MKVSLSEGLAGLPFGRANEICADHSIFREPFIERVKPAVDVSASVLVCGGKDDVPSSNVGIWIENPDDLLPPFARP